MLRRVASVTRIPLARRIYAFIKMLDGQQISAPGPEDDSRHEDQTDNSQFLFRASCEQRSDSERMKGSAGTSREQHAGIIPPGDPVCAETFGTFGFIAGSRPPARQNCRHLAHPRPAQQSL